MLFKSCFSVCRLRIAKMQSGRRFKRRYIGSSSHINAPVESKEELFCNRLRLKLLRGLKLFRIASYAVNLDSIDFQRRTKCVGSRRCIQSLSVFLPKVQSLLVMQRSLMGLTPSLTFSSMCGTRSFTDRQKR